MAALGFVLGTVAAFRSGHLQVAPGPPGTSSCGFMVISGLVLMMGAPIVGIACGIVGGCLGAMLDLVLAAHWAEKRVIEDSISRD
jgi:hypothetical protein